MAHVDISINNQNGNIILFQNSKLCDTTRYLCIKGKVFLLSSPRLNQKLCLLQEPILHSVEASTILKQAAGVILFRKEPFMYRTETKSYNFTKRAYAPLTAGSLC